MKYIIFITNFYRPKQSVYPSRNALNKIRDKY